MYTIDRLLASFGGFDAVFCMAVLRTRKRKKIAEEYPFHRFEERARFLDSLVKPGGLLVIHNSTYRFSDTVHQSSYETLPVAISCDKTYMPDGATEVEPDGCIFYKLLT